MKLEDQVISLPLAKKMKKLGFKQESLYDWVVKDVGSVPILTNQTQILQNPPTTTKYQHYSAYTVAELGEILAKVQAGFVPQPNSNSEGGWYKEMFDGPTIHEDTEVNARAKMLIYLKEKNLINTKEE